MNKLNEYKIAFRGLKEGKHSFDFLLDHDFFSCFEATKDTKGQMNAVVEISKTALLMEVKVSINGIINTICDRCLAPLDLPISGEMEFIVKQSEREEGNDDDYIIITPEDDYLDMSTYLYETFMLNYPIRAVHNDGECDENMQGVLHEYVRNEDEKPLDPRWDELRKLINN